MLLSITSFAHGIKVTQKPEVLFDQPKNSAELVCETDDTTYYNIYWYRQGKKEGLALIAHSPGEGRETAYEENFKNVYEVKRSTATHSSLMIKSLSSELSAVYYCATSEHTDTEVHRCCTQTDICLKLLAN
ncbi:hypothetical protein HHUSO_G21634 [Huso huso]|uniref:Ig-like domain-containing protein n=1 Tax=Huso huso TaxID=61971 RepID=A0ABR0YZH7_HUSHU